MPESRAAALEKDTCAPSCSPRRLIDRLSVPLTVVLALFIVRAANPISYDPDLYWHLKAGEYIVATGSLPYADVFSHTAYGKDWVLHEWLTEVLFYGIARTAGLKGVWFFVAALYAATFIVLYRLCATLLESSTKALVVALLFFAPVVAFASPRPQIFTYLLFAIYLRILVHWKYRGDVQQLKWLPLLMLLWVNLHGAAIVGIALLLLFLLTEAVSSYIGVPSGPRKIVALQKLAAWTGLAALATLVNPRFLDYWLYPFQVIGLSLATSVINEWKSPDFHSMDGQYVLALFILFFAAIAYSRRKPDLPEFAIPVFFIAAGFTSIRHVPLACIAALPFFSMCWKHVEFSRFERFAAMTRITPALVSRDLDDRLVPYLNALLLSIVIASVAYSQTHRSSDDLVQAVMPVKAANYIIEHGISGNMMNEYGEGGYLMYRLHPHARVFIDGRADMYGDSFMEEYLAIVGGKAAWEDKFRKYAIDFALLPRDVPLRQLLLASKDFKLVYDDARHSVFTRDTRRFESLPAVRPLTPEMVTLRCAYRGAALC